MLCNGFGEHNIQGIGDKHIPLIHNVMNTDVARRRLRPRDRPARRPLRHRRGRAYLAGRRGVAGGRARRSCRRSASRASATSSPRSRPRSSSASARTTSSSRSPPTAPRCTTASATLAAAKYFPDGFDDGRRRRGLRRAPARRRDRPPARADARGARAHLQPRLLHLGRAAGRLDRRSSQARRDQAFWERTRAQVAGLGRADRRVQRAHRRPGEAVTPASAASSAPAAARSPPRRAVPVPLPERGHAATSTTSCSASSTRPRVRFPGGDAEPNPFIRYRQLLHAYHVARGRRHGRRRVCALVRGSTSGSPRSTGTASR